MRDEEFLKTLENQTLIWDWKDDVPFELIQECVLEGFIYLRLADTQSDNHGLVLTKERIVSEEADFLYGYETEKHFEKEDEGG